MPPRGRNEKKESGRAKKAENKQKKREAAALAKEKKEAAEWAVGAKSNKAAEEKAAKKAADAARKAENARLLAEEEAAAISKPKQALKAGKGKVGPPPPNPTGPSAFAAGGGLGSAGTHSPQRGEEPAESFAATGIDDALDFLEVVNAKTDKASVGQQAASIESHPERRFKAALEAYQERELPRIKHERPGLRFNQYKDLLFKEFQKSPDNPHNRTLVAYNATKEERAEALSRRKKGLEAYLRQDG